MTKEINTYEEYLIEMRLQIATLIPKLYEFKKTEDKNGIRECSELASLVMDLGSISDKLRPYVNNHILTQNILIDELIESIDVEKMDNLFNVALLRYTFSVKQHLKYWISFRDKVKIKLDNEGHDSNRILKGLYERKL